MKQCLESMLTHVWHSSCTKSRTQPVLPHATFKARPTLVPHWHANMEVASSCWRHAREATW
ncbi:hypothetical protein CHLRE_02g102276v5 [Chlamydomonas reinhardtii]|uniref:Uncharacterized protein n=1 Tax=Chlamydomonas reinhardtii TaxID=3055 RepID=A0A2K3E2E0_CHLRE|nr:uncharacterized protein CHLRE_02g102276v5 [Chlamydomonas reinhardtii]XP_042927376.1 uncharacterized protein CHLRE_02g102276v5 [Chlamydomonas reinhardtii]PNW86943.1 hypothetical protein CHLRE_02g102276v5 [Chlamydomonas reinhardtii]PNW86944.1 hypothetical protein CHLRE_02g102276v5 [Chlamydomonas reinhardtii]